MTKNILLLAFVMLTTASTAQNSFEGTWEGKVTAGVELRVIFTLTQSENKEFKAIMDLPDNGIKGIVSKDVMVNNDSLVIHIKEFQGSYSGKLINPTTISGNWKQGISTPLQLNKVEKVQTLYRPQTPLPPFPYKSEDTLYTSKDGSIQYGATLSMPFGEGPFPAVILITGSGQQNRDEEVAGHKPFAVIADHLTRNGFAVLRVDDRGVGQTTGDVKKATSLDFADDVSTGLDYLISRKEINKEKLGLIGHSEGGMIAPILAAKRSDIAAIVLLAAPGNNTPEVLVEQNEAFLTSNGLPEDYVTSYVNLYSSIIRLMKNNPDKQRAKAEVTAEVENWIKKTPASIVAATTNIKNDQQKASFIEAMVGTFGTPWFQYFLNYEPQKFLENITCKVLALNGEKDIQILAKSNLAGIETALKKSKSRGYKVKEYEGLNHLFQKCNTCSIKEYGELEETISMDVLKDITAWLKIEM